MKDKPTLTIDITRVQSFAIFVQKMVFEHLIRLAREVRQHADTMRFSRMLHDMLETIRGWVETSSNLPGLIVAYFDRLNNDKVQKLK